MAVCNLLDCKSDLLDPLVFVYTPVQWLVADSAGTSSKIEDNPSD